MTKAVFTAKATSKYDDLPENRYHFPKSYLNQVEQSVGDWIVYYEPRRLTENLSNRDGRQAYFGVAKVDRIERDEALENHYYAYVSNYLELDHAVPFKNGTNYFEALLKKSDGSTNKGAFGRSVRMLTDAEFESILNEGYSHIIGKTPRYRPEPDVPEEPSRALLVAENVGSYNSLLTDFDVNRPLVKSIVNRPFRDRAFSTAVKAAYRDTCAVTGIKIINGGGRSEVQAAHIKAVADRGPDSIRNGIALSATVHWLFDRKLLSIDEDHTILLAEDLVPDTVKNLVNQSGKLIVPNVSIYQPHPEFLKYHREHCFKG